VTGRLLLAVAGLAAFSAAIPAIAQPTLGTAVEARTPVALPPEKQQLVKQRLERIDPPPAELPEAARVGMTIPPETTLVALPEDMATEVPTVTSYRFVLAGDVIAVVDSASRQVIQLIKR
jgi:hypothetical protein